ncbi:magnesium transporter MgtE N-terminal domain-containing protein [Aestuariimicrobium kwangyangense]|uniref:magnesium transporter MgtE N-terminal domain-containing protein n=1 Tax=Aestuariimicrobium kwangyangense TaxID=396389 RepID=UPI0003B3E69E|nr:CBS domain-containing protein [Aestuariimicrobium kwangyangense]
MSTSAVFISRLRGVPVLDASGDQVGRVRDVVIQLRVGGRAPRCRGLVVELFARRKIFLPMARVHAIDASQVSIQGVLDTRPFQRREVESLVIDDLFDREVTRPGQPPAVVHDVSMHQVRSREWELAEVALRERLPGGRFRLGRGGNVVQVSWRDLPELLLKGSQSTEHLVAQMADMKPADVARELHDMDPGRRAEVAQALDDEQLANAIEELPEEEQVELIQSLDTERAVDVLEEMDPDDAADLIKELPEPMAEDLLQRMEPEEARDVRALLNYEEFTAGAMMTPEPVILAVDATVADGLARVRNEDLSPALASMVFICRAPLDTPSGRYLGAVHVQRLLREPPMVMAAGLVDSGLEPIRPEASLAEVSRYFATYNLVVAPVVDADQRLIGAVTVDDVLDHLLPEDWRGDQFTGLEATEGTREDEPHATQPGVSRG